MTYLALAAAGTAWWAKRVWHRDPISAELGAVFSLSLLICAAWVS